MIEATMQNLQQQMDKSIASFKEAMSKLRTGRANPGMVETLTVNYYGTPTLMSQIANISAPDARTLIVQPWDAGALDEIEKAIQKAELGITPQNDGKMIRLPMPPLTEDSRKEVVKQAGNLAEEARIAVRNIRRNGIDIFKKAQKDKELTEDDLKKAQEKVQKLTDDFTKKVDEILDQKSSDIMKV
ncbi:MAG: ribosome recycling factor [Bdellovibrionota bacterium]|nr:ribosome recycling factor [Deltaproteobacteria bacterium]